MAFWITHLAVADALMERFPLLERREFCIGNIAPDCNIENEDWTSFTPPREMTHFMRAKDKSLDDAERFFLEYISGKHFSSPRERSFLLGYYAHLVTDVMYQNSVRDEERVKNVWKRIYADRSLSQKAKGLAPTWANAKSLFPKETRLLEQQSIEAEYLENHPGSGYLTEILPIKTIETYLSFLPGEYIVRKIGVMASVPDPTRKPDQYYTITKEEYGKFLSDTIAYLEREFRKKAAPV